MYRTFLFAFFVLVVISAVSGYSAGAPEEACGDMKPNHPFDPQKSAFPYTVTVSQSEIKSGDKVQITLSGGKDEESYKGFLLQVRSGDKSVGSFVISADNEKYAKTLDCHDAKKTAVTHKNGTSKTTLTFDWIAPAKLQGKVDVYATVAKDGEVFWVGNKQAEFKVV